MFVEVSLPLPVLKNFYYRCPASLFEQLQPGQRLLVPFQNRKLTGYLIRSFEQLPADFPNLAIKEIFGAIDSESLISRDLFELSHWIAEYYFASHGEVLKACLPPRVDLNTRKVAHLTMAGLDALEDAARLADCEARDQEILRSLRQGSPLSFHQLGRRLGCEINDRALRKLLNQGWIEVRQDLVGRVTSHKQQTVVSLHDPQIATSCPAGLSLLQSKVISYLREQGQPTPLSNLLDSLRISDSAVKSLEKKGLIVLSKERLDRDPFKAIQGFLPAERREHTEEQLEVLRELKKAQETGSFAPILLHGVTGSGKTEVYQCMIEETLAKQKTALLLMPEIGLTPRVAQEFRERLGSRVAILHSGLSDGERFDEWWRIWRCEAGVVIGTRSAIFAPLHSLGLIIVDEEHDSSYKQQDRPRYHARDCALVRGKLTNALVVLGSATPAIETSFNARSGKYGHLRMTSRVQARRLPEVVLVDMRAEFRDSGRNPVFSTSLRDHIQQRLDKKEQVLILLNRRGFSASVLCRSCGQNIQCRNCSISLTFHRGANRLRCHYCSYEQGVPKICPRCSSEHLYFQREGTEKIEALLEKSFPQARISRLDRDTAQRRNAHGKILSQFQRGETDILTGTQMIAKGHDFHNVTLVGILSADASLAFPDFRCAERTFQLLSQMSGRAGRGDLPGQVLIQTFHPEHYCLKFVAQHNYEGFYEKEIRFRKVMHYPPFTAMANVLVRDPNLETAAGIINTFAEIFQKLAVGQIRILGPALSPLAKLKGKHRFNLMMKSSSRQLLRETLRVCLKRAEEKGVDIRRIHIDIDPVDLM
jgi:primosomal protein N' (replication factor Y) (superfamily II helicase)